MTDTQPDTECSLCGDSHIDGACWRDETNNAYIDTDSDYNEPESLPEDVLGYDHTRDTNTEYDVTATAPSFTVFMLSMFYGGIALWLFAIGTHWAGVAMSAFLLATLLTRLDS